MPFTFTSEQNGTLGLKICSLSHSSGSNGAVTPCAKGSFTYIRLMKYMCVCLRVFIQRSGNNLKVICDRL